MTWRATWPRSAKGYAYVASEIEERKPTPWGIVEVTIADPFGNKQTIWQEAGSNSYPPAGGFIGDC